MMGFVRAAAVLALAAAACATAPVRRDLPRATTVPRDFEATWSALIDLFAEREWAIDHLDKDAGLIATDWVGLGEQGHRYADCGVAKVDPAQPIQVRFRVRAKPAQAEKATEVTVDAAFRQIRSFDGNSSFMDCPSRGAVEAQIQDKLAGRTRAPPAAVAANPGNDPALAAAYWCSDRDGVCSADRSACLGGCEKLDEVWCSRFHTRDGAGYLCGMTRNACWGLLDKPELRQGRSDFGECGPQKAAGPVSPPRARSGTSRRPIARRERTMAIVTLPSRGAMRRA